MTTEQPVTTEQPEQPGQPGKRPAKRPAKKRQQAGTKATVKDGYVLEDQIGFLLRKANQRHRSIFGNQVKNNIAPAQFSALAKLHQLGPLSQNHLGRLIALDSATIKGVVNRLVQADYVTSERSEDDARLRIIDLTTHGRIRIKGLLPLAEEITQLTLAPLNDQEAKTLHRLLSKIAGSLD